MHRRREITSHQKVIAAFHDTCWITSEPARDPSHLYHGNQHHTTVHAHTLRGAIAMASSAVATKKLSATRPIYSAANWTLSQPSVHHSLFHSLSSPFPSLFFFTMNFFCHEPEELPFISRGQGLAVLSRSGSPTSGDRGKEALQGSREMPRDAAEPAPHARIHHHYHHQREQQRQ